MKQTAMNKKVQNRAIEINTIITFMVIIIIGNIIIEPPILFHNYGHFGILTHPIASIKELFFSWGYNQHSFIFSLKGLQMYFNGIPVMFHKYGFIKATFAYLTQFSPVWAFLPMKLLFDSCIEFLNNDNIVPSAEQAKGTENE